jgi:hypothetical protein
VNKFKKKNKKKNIKMSKKNSQHSVILNVDILPLILAYFSDDVKNQYDVRDQYEIYNYLFIHSTWTKVSLLFKKKTVFFF